MKNKELTALEAYERLCNHLDYDDDYMYNGSYEEDNEVIEKSLKALEIIKEKEVNIQYFKICLEVHWDYDLFEEHCRENNEWEDDTPYKYSMKKEEFDLLKEVLL